MEIFDRTNPEEADEYFLHYGSTAKGLKEVAERLDEMKLNEKDAKDYKRYLNQLRDVASEQHTKMADAQELINKGRAEKEIEAVVGLFEIGLAQDKIETALKISAEKLSKIIDNHNKK